ncbi:chtBD2 [Erannis ankeraria nucleopolyhedrovirus]|uniref:chtBD2 n=1 Tax=Erannis ankeraria nucleopolyhedrovirus TaxID=2913600 RepID=UPI0024819D8D|nr:chtBD2 [Erannis ankeraria nucleopolyhedrovirus]UJZ88958.1 chtBD2 [Erannis ankeraria nucleopolyhedrovirus]
MWLLLALFIVMKLLVFHKMKKMHVDLHHTKICPKGYNGLAPDPFDCNGYYLCPESLKMYCPSNTQFNIDEYDCVSNDLKNGCVEVLTRNLLM